MNILKRLLFCKHTYEFVRNIYGDEIGIQDGNVVYGNAVNVVKLSIRNILKNKVNYE